MANQQAVKTALTFMWLIGKVCCQFKNLRAFFMTNETGMEKKSKVTIYMNEKEEFLLNELFIKRLRDRRKTTKSALFCEGIRLLSEKEMGDVPHA